MIEGITCNVVIFNELRWKKWYCISILKKKKLRITKRIKYFLLKKEIGLDLFSYCKKNTIKSSNNKSFVFYQQHANATNFRALKKKALK